MQLLLTSLNPLRHFEQIGLFFIPEHSMQFSILLQFSQKDLFYASTGK